MAVAPAEVDTARALYHLLRARARDHHPAADAEVVVLVLLNSRDLVLLHAVVVGDHPVTLVLDPRHAVVADVHQVILVHARGQRAAGDVDHLVPLLPGRAATVEDAEA